DIEQVRRKTLAQRYGARVVVDALCERGIEARADILAVVLAGDHSYEDAAFGLCWRKSKYASVVEQAGFERIFVVLVFRHGTADHHAAAVAAKDVSVVTDDGRSIDGRGRRVENKRWLEPLCAKDDFRLLLLG